MNLIWIALPKEALSGYLTAIPQALSFPPLICPKLNLNYSMTAINPYFVEKWPRYQVIATLLNDESAKSLLSEEILQKIELTFLRNKF